MPARDNTARLAKALWSEEALKLSPSDFESRFDSIYSAAEGISTYWHLGGAANDYLRRFPESIRVPPELATKLLASAMIDGRIIGLKLLNRCSSDLNLICAHICEALKSQHTQELYGGLCELSNLLERLSPPAAISVFNLLQQLAKLKSSRDSYIRECANRYSDWLGIFA